MRHADVLVHIPADRTRRGPAQLLVQLEDTSEQDRPSFVVSRLIADLSELRFGTQQVLALELPYIASTRALHASALISDNVLPGPKRGDLMTTGAVAVEPGRQTHIHLTRYV
jgi:hypothetical protein